MFPYTVTVEYYRGAGKHFVSPQVLAILERIYAAMRRVDGVSLYSVQATRAQNSAKILLDFLACCLDKHLKVYEYKSYIGLALFLDNTLPTQVTFEEAVERRLNLFKFLLYDDYCFEARSYLGKETATQDRRDDTIVLQRMARIVRCLTALNNNVAQVVPCTPEETAALSLLTPLHDGEADTEKVSQGWAVVEMLRQSTYWDHSVPIDLLLELSMLPVYVNHEEYNFIRILQAFEAIFNIVIMGLQAVINCVYDDRIREASHHLKLLCDVFRIDVFLFRILMTMPREDFQIFRQYTEGASAIQSPQYKLIEVLMGTPSSTRWSSPAFKFVPQIRLFLERTGLNLECVLRERFGKDGEGLNLEGVNDEQALGLFLRINTLDRMFLDWKKRHFGIASHMIGSDTGTGGSDVIEYLGRFKGELFFPELEKTLSQRDPSGYILLEPKLCPR